MNLTRDRLRSIGWVTLLSLCLALTAALSLRVNAVKSEVHQAERRIVQMRKEMTFLETEYQTRSNQHQLRTLNDIEFGYTAPRARQYIEGERQLAVLGVPRGPGAPAMIRVAEAPQAAAPGAFPPMVSPISGVAAHAGQREQDDGGLGDALADAPTDRDDPVGAAIGAERLGDRLARIGPPADRAR
jgi:hypothetical protein